MSARPAIRRVSATFSRNAAPDEGGVAFLALLLRRFPYHDADEWTARIRAGQVLLDGALATPETPVLAGALIEYRVEDYEEPAVPIDFREVPAAPGAHPDLALVHKPAGLPVHKTGRVFVHVLANLYRAARGDDAWSPLNRLDAETSGIVAFARGAEALRRFAPGNPGTMWTKTYLAVTRAEPGATPLPARHDGPLAEWRDHRIRSRMRVHADGKPATTLFRVLALRGDLALVLARPETGRKHQIRAHLADLGHPVLGDKVYAHEGHYYLKRIEGELTAEDVAALGAPRQLLHALSLGIRDEGGEGISGTDLDLPENFRRYFPEATVEFLAEALTANPF